MKTLPEARFINALRPTPGKIARGEETPTGRMYPTPMALPNCGA
jgi:hypothetical protein